MQNQFNRTARVGALPSISFDRADLFYHMPLMADWSLSRAQIMDLAKYLRSPFPGTKGCVLMKESARNNLMFADMCEEAGLLIVRVPDRLTSSPVKEWYNHLATTYAPDSIEGQDMRIVLTQRARLAAQQPR